MYLVVLCIIILKLDPSIAQFPRHMDFQKVGETIFNNEIYNILRPSTHIVSDYFTDYLLRRENLNFPTKRLFIDDNGFRHYWSGFDKVTKSLRKTEILSNVMETVENTDDKPDTKTTTTEKANSNEASVNENNNSSKNVEHGTELESTANVAKDKENKTQNESSSEKTTTLADDIEIVTIKSSDFESKKKSLVTEIHLRGGATTKAPKEKEKEKNIVTTTFFCPFFGVITMSAFVD